MNMYVIYDFNGFVGVFDNKEKMNEFIKKVKIKFIEVVGEDYCQGEDYQIYECELNKGFEI